MYVCIYKYIYLGVIFRSDMSMDKHISSVVKNLFPSAS